MAFNTAQFENTQFEPSTALIPVDNSPLAEFFDEGEKPEFMIRGLTASEMATARSQIEEGLREVMQQINTQQPKEVGEAVAKIMGISGDIHDDTVMRISWLEMGSVEPKLTRQHCVRISEVAPIEFVSMTTEIIALTGKGQTNIQKPSPSGKEVVTTS